MNVNIQSLGFKAGEALEAHITQKLQQLTPGDHIVSATVTLFLGPDRGTAREHFCEIRLEVPGNDPFIKESAADFYQAADATIDKLQMTLRKQKEKQVDAWQGRENI